MTANGWLQFAIYSVVLILTVRHVGLYLARVLEGGKTWLDPILRPIERLTYKLCGVQADKGHDTNQKQEQSEWLGRQAHCT